MNKIVKAPYEQSVFLNCPFDEHYHSLFQSMIFAIIDCGFTPRCALEVSDASQVRIQKIYDLIAECKFGIHDLSRIKLDENSQLPRFNMPLELGIFLGAKFLGESKQQEKMCLVFDEEPYRYQKYLSDISGQDISSHRGDPHIVASKIRDWLTGFRPELLPSGSIIWKRYERFQKELRGFCEQAKHTPQELTYLDYVNHAMRFVAHKDNVLKTGLKMRWGNELQNPSMSHIKEAIEAFKGGSSSYAILSKSELTYMQCLGGKSWGHLLNYQEGSINEHYECINSLDEKDVIEMFVMYSNDNEDWRTKFRWEKQKL